MATRPHIEHSRAWALRLVQGGDFSGCSLLDLERAITLTGSRKAIAERSRRIAAYGPQVKDAAGNLRR